MQSISSESIVGNSVVGRRTPDLLSAPRKSGEARYAEHQVEEVDTHPRRRLVAGINHNPPGGVPGMGIRQRQAEAVPVVLADSDSCSDALKVLATPFVFIGGTIFGAFCGVFCGGIMGAILVKNIADSCICSPCVTVLLAPVFAVCCLVLMISYPLTRGILIGTLSGGFLCCSKMWVGTPIFRKEAKCCDAPMIVSMVEE